MKRLTVSCAALGWNLLERHGATRLAGIAFEPRASVFPAVTCVAQATLRTGLPPAEHGLVANGVWLSDLRRPSFWEQSAALVKGRRVWEDRRAAGDTVGMYFFQQSLGECVDAVLSPAPIHKHGGGMVMRNYSQPPDLAERIRRRLGTFPLWRYWGPLASPRVGRCVLDTFETAQELFPTDEAYLYLPTLDYCAQRTGPDSPAADRAFAEFTRQLERIVRFAERTGAALVVEGDYDITPVTAGPLFPNAALRRAGLFKVRDVAGRAYPDLYASEAFALCDHAVAQVCVRADADVSRVRDLFAATGDYALSETRPSEHAPFAFTLTAKPGAWCAYDWWTDRREAPDYATHVDIHNKPGYDPGELFFRPAPFKVRGTHGRPCTVAVGRLSPD